MPTGPDLATAIIDDPYGTPNDAPATREQRTAGAEREWVPPARPQIVVVRTFRHDPIGRMHARHQITEAEYQAGRAYQILVETAQGRSTRSCDLDGGGGARSGPGLAPVSDVMLRAGRRLRATNARIRARYGTEGLDVTRAVLVEHRRLDQLQDEGQGPRFWGFLLRRCLAEVAILLGLANKPR
jgi:hypothetical protein